MSIHSKQSRSFMTETVRAGAWHMRLLEHSFTPDFKAIPPAYTEPNNRSTMKNLSFVREKVAAWVADGHVEKLAQKATCNSPLTVVDKVDSATGKVKQRLCLDTSRHVNKFLHKHHTNFEDLSATACLYSQGVSRCVFRPREPVFSHQAFAGCEAGHQEAEDRLDFKQQRTDGNSSSRGQAGHQAEEDRRDFEQQRTGGTTSSRGQGGQQAAEDRRDNKQQRTGGTTSSR